MIEFNLWDKKEKEMLGPFRLIDVTVMTRPDKGSKAVVEKDNQVIEIDKIGPRYLGRPAGESKEEFLGEVA